MTVEGDSVKGFGLCVGRVQLSVNFPKSNHPSSDVLAY